MVRGLGAAATVLSLLASGCHALDRFEDGGATVFVFATHHATPENGSFPFRGDENQPRTFESSDGWTVTLLEAYVTISAVTLIGCNGSEHELRMFWGPCPEDLRDRDLATLTVAGNHVGEGEYCALEVEYAAYMPPIIDEEAEDTRLRSLVSETPLAERDYRQAQRHADAMERHRRDVSIEIARLEATQDELLDRLLVEPD